MIYLTNNTNRFKTKEAAEQARTSMQGFMLAGRNLRVGMGGANQTQNFNQYPSPQPNNGNPSPDNTTHFRSHIDNTQASVLDNSDVAGISYSNSVRSELMKNLLREEDGLKPMPPVISTNKTEPITRNPSRCVVVQNMFNATEETDPNWVQNLELDVKEECESKYGEVVHISVDPNTEKGEVYIKFKTVDQGMKAVAGLDGRYFDGRMLTALPFVEIMYNIK